MGFSFGTNTTSANPYIPSRGMPATPPSFGLPQNHTLSTDPFNQQAQLLSMGMLLPAFDSYGGNKGYYSNQTYQTSPLMQRYLMPQNQTSNWLQHSMGMGMPGWTANGNGTFNAGQYNPFMALNYPGNQPQQGQQAPQQMPQLPRQAAPGQQPAQQSFTPEFISNAQSVGLSPEVAYAYQNDPQVKAYFDALNAQKAGASPASDGAQSTAPNVGTMTANEAKTLQFEGAAPTQLMTPGEVMAAEWRRRYLSGGRAAGDSTRDANGQIMYSQEYINKMGSTPTMAQVYANAKKILDGGGTLYDNDLSSVNTVPEGGASVWGAIGSQRDFGRRSTAAGLSPAPTQGGAGLLSQGGLAPPSEFSDEFKTNAASVGLSPESAWAYQNNPQVKAYFDALNAKK